MPSSDLSDNTTKKDSENGALAHTLTHKECCYCFQHIHQSAKVCHHCGHHQFWFWNHFKLELIGLLISVIMVMIAAFQLNEARKERIAAKDALLKAQSTEARVLELHQLFTQHALSVISSTYLSMVTKNEIGTKRDQKAVEETLKDINMVLPELIPDPDKRQAWINNLQQKIPQTE